MPLVQLSEEQVEVLVGRDRVLFVEVLVSLLRAVYMTNYVWNAEHAVSLGLVANPSRGKSELLGIFNGSMPKTKLINDVSAYKIETDLLPKVRRGELLSIAITDLTAALEKSETAKKPLISMLLALTEEGLTYKKSYVSDVEVQKPIRLQLFFGITPDMLGKYMPSWTRSGFSSRMLYASWDYTKEQIDAIIRNKIQQPDLVPGAKKANRKIVFPKVSRDYYVKIPERFDERIQILAESVVAETNYSYVVRRGEKEKVVELKVLEPVRTSRELATLLRAICLCRHLDEDLPRENIAVNDSDFVELCRFARFLNLKKNLLAETN